ncbi:PREDICTED: epididymal secretory protein E1-like isoform X9 [Acropora digitifera]|uniref:epididymal secretory protein E1-like isoform X9 n=1 Tax=Acropora digitifera TaxID=70779 RepID=UPI00077A2385|nr:PREDICTED: epididymal secretory protein E1-like isoform X9 [Acropora digitifera]
MFKMKRPCVLALLTLLNLSFVLGKSVHFRDCGSKKSSISQVIITPCQAEPCQLKKGLNESVEVIFKPTEVVTSAKVVIHGIIEGVRFPFPFPHPNGCKEHGLECPLKPNKEYTFKATLPVKRTYQDLKLHGVGITVLATRLF